MDLLTHNYDSMCLVQLLHILLDLVPEFCRSVFDLGQKLHIEINIAYLSKIDYEKVYASSSNIVEKLL